ncbi:matrilin-2 [Microcaecilia unicolor]|uniref:Matrilin-2 n=1 Tax=Microcaecilia unicolor TaxID=1415580 RepID=A0A6P7ZC02_9AMPH|nr:matrilin-2 [Microcaecilia unicolor]
MKTPLTCLLLLSLGLALLDTIEARERRQQWPLRKRGNDARLQANLLDNVCDKKPLDLVFIIDSSRSVRPYDYGKVKEFIITILKFLDIRPDMTRVGLLQYGSTVKHEFSLKTYRRKVEVENAVRRMMHLATGTMTGLAIQYMMNIAFSEAEGARPLSQNVPRIAMIVTDGRPQDSVAKIAAKARNSGILIFAVGVGKVDLNTLKSIGSEPHAEHVFLVANFSQIETLTSVFQNKLCADHLCTLVAHGCDHFCINTPGSYICTCKQGYLMNPDQKTCSIQDLCAIEEHGCEQICVNTPGSYVCQCFQGYELDKDGKKCTIVDYCALPNHGCQHKCINTGDSYFCRCQQGYLLNADKKTCRRPDYCALFPHSCQHECVNTDESYFCRCRQGFTLNPDRTTCQKIDHCALGNHGCDHECINTEESFVCGCHKGYHLNPDSKSCRRINHCAEKNHGCEQLCLNTPESYICQCSEGFVINQDLKTCSRVDHCALGIHNCEQLCINTEEYYTCQCFEGFVLREDGKTCQSADICKSTDHGCEHICVNNENSYSCACFEGYRLAEDGKQCKRCAEGPIDLVFVIDGSKSLGEQNFEIVKGFVNGILSSLQISPKAARVGLVQYSTQVRTEFTLGHYGTSKEVKKAVSQIKYMGKGSMTGFALKVMVERSFSETEGARPSWMGVPKVAIVFTDGRAQDDVSKWASKAKQNGITIFAIGVGKAIEEELREIASVPEDKHLFYTEDFSSMGNITKKLKARICEGWTQRAEKPEIPNSVFLAESKSSSRGAPLPFTCSIPTVQFRPLVEDTPLDEKDDQCKCKNIVESQNNANEEVRRLTKQLEAITQRMEALENRLRYR